MPIIELQGKSPRIDPSARIFEPATVIGDVTIGAESTVWYGSVIRGDVNTITIGSRTNIQDLSCLHVTWKKWPLAIGCGVTIGHMCMLHGCTIEDNVLIGMKALVMDGAIIRSGSLLGAGSLVTEGTEIPSGKLAFGSPARVIRDLTGAEKEQLERSAANYVKYRSWYGAALD